MFRSAELDTAIKRNIQFMQEASDLRKQVDQLSAREPRRVLEPYFDEVQAYAVKAKCGLPAAANVLRIRRLRDAIQSSTAFSRETKDIWLAHLDLVHGAEK